MARKELNFTKDALERLPLPEPGKRAEFYDAKTSGLHVRVTSSGVKSFAVLRWIAAEGKPERITLGRFPSMSIEQARKQARQINGAISDGDNPAEAIREKRAEPTLAEGFEIYFDRHLKPTGKRTAADFRSMFESWLSRIPEGGRKAHGRKREKPAGSVDWSAKKLSTIKPHDVRRLHAAVGATGKRTMANRVVELLSALFNKLAEWGEFKGTNPAVKIEPYRETKRDRFIQGGELPRFFTALAEDTSEDFRDFVSLSLLTGARRGNVLGMRWRDLDMAGLTWRIPAADSKNGEPMLIDLTAEALGILQRREIEKVREELKRRELALSAGTPFKPVEFVFPAKSAAGYMTNPKKRWADLLARAGIDDLRIHDLRRSLGSWQAKTGASLAVIGKTLGHKDPSATLIYARLDRDPIRESVERATSAILKAGGEAAGRVIPLQQRKRA